MQRILDEPAYILHSRPFRDTSLLLDVLTKSHGRIGLLARGVRKKNSRSAGLLQAFIPLSLSFAGKSSLKTVMQIDSMGMPFLFNGQNLYSALYVNEVLYRLLPQNDSDEVIFHLYTDCLSHLCHGDIETVLRQFEFRLLKHLGFGQSYKQDESGLPIESALYYEYLPEKGWKVFGADCLHPNLYLGEHLLAIGQETYNPEVLKVAKKLSRLLIQNLITKPIASRKLFHPV